MCDFEPGDEVVRIAAPGDGTGAPPVGWTGRVTEVLGPTDPEWPDAVAFLLDNWPLPDGLAHNASHWRKAQRRDLSTWLKTAVGDTDKLDRSRRERAPAHS